MNGQHSYLLVEGPQDVVFVGRILQELGFQNAQSISDIPARWQPFIDGFAHEQDQRRRAAGRDGIPFWQIFKPACLFSGTLCLVIEQVGGNRTKFGKTLRATNQLLEGGLAGLSGVGLMPDADADPGASLASARQALQSLGLPAPESNQLVVHGAPNTGIFVLPGGEDAGGLEEMLVECAQAVYPALLAGATAFVSSVDVGNAYYTPDDMREMRTPQGPIKARIGSVSSVLKPGSTIQVSVLRDRWVSAETLAVPRVAALVQFLKSLCGLP